MALQLRALISFAVVAEERSFTRAAERMGLTQPWVSEQVRQLEEYLGFPLFVRSTRRLDLTPEGAELLAYATRLVDLRDEAEDWVRRAKTAQSSRLRIGTLASTASIPERAELIDRFIAVYEHVEVEVVEDRLPVLMGHLESRELDLVIAFDRDHFERPEFEILRLAQYEAYLLVPQEDPLSRLERVGIAALEGRSIVTTPSRVNPNLVESLEQLVAGHSIRLVSAPESNRKAVERFARHKRMSVFRWRAPGLPRTEVEDMVQVPLEAPFLVQLVVVRNANMTTRNIDRFWRLAVEISPAAEGVV
jgi:DNA-binding transcriptional LysR family regulator